MRDSDRRHAEFTEFVRHASPELLRVAWFLTGDVHRANDVVQSALVKTYVAWPRIVAGREMGYVRRILTNENVDRWRSRRREVLVPDATLTDKSSGGDPAKQVADVDALVAALRALPRRQREVVVIRYYCDLSEQDVAAELGISVGTVKSNGARGLEAIRVHLSQEEWSHGY